MSETQNRYLISLHSKFGIRWFCMSEEERRQYWATGLNSDTLGFNALSDAKIVAKSLLERPENQHWNMSIRIAKWEGDHFNFWEVNF